MAAVNRGTDDESRDEQHIDTDVTLEGTDSGTATIRVTRTETTVTHTVDELFDADGRLVLWADDFGWSGFERRADGFYQVNFGAFLPDSSGEQGQGAYISCRQVDEQAVVDAIDRHVRDPQAGGAGRFERGCTPP